MRSSVFIINFAVIIIMYTSVFAVVAAAEQQNSRYLINLGEYWPDIDGYNFSFSIPNGYEVSNVTFLYNCTIVVNLTGPPIFDVADYERYEDEPADDLSIDIDLWNYEEDFNFEWLNQCSCGGPTSSLSNMSIRKTSGYDNYYIKNIGCYYCAEPEFEGW